MISTAFGVGRENAANFVPHAPEHDQLLFVGAGGVRRIVKAPMVAVQLAGNIPSQE